MSPPSPPKFMSCGLKPITWRRANLDAPFAWDAPLPLTGAKRFFFPARERLLQWHTETVEETITVPPPFALFGLRACDPGSIGALRVLRRLGEIAS